MSKQTFPWQPKANTKSLLVYISPRVLKLKKGAKAHSPSLGTLLHRGRTRYTVLLQSNARQHALWHKVCKTQNGACYWAWDLTHWCQIHSVWKPVNQRITLFWGQHDLLHWRDCQVMNFINRWMGQCVMLAQGCGAIQGCDRLTVVMSLIWFAALKEWCLAIVCIEDFWQPLLLLESGSERDIFKPLIIKITVQYREITL